MLLEDREYGMNIGFLSPSFMVKYHMLKGWTNYGSSKYR